VIVNVKNGLSVEQEGRIRDVIYTLTYGVDRGWTIPAASVDACIEVLQKVRRMFPPEKK
jgi:hypothetical protein